MILSSSACFFQVECIAENRADDAADDMRHIGDVVLHENAVEDLMTDIDHGYQNERERNITFFEFRERG